MHTIIKGAYLWTLESELAADPATVEKAILVQGLFARQICLTESQAFDNWGTIEFFTKHETTLLRMLRDLEAFEIPLIGTCARKDANWYALLDDRLAPNVDGRFPTYCSMLRPEQNNKIREGYQGLNSQGRRDRLFEVAGPQFRSHLDRLSTYFESSKQSTIVKGSRRPQETLYETVQREIQMMNQAGIAPLSNLDRRVVDNILEAISVHPANEKQTREKLHWAIYEGQSPPVFKKKVYPTQAQTHTQVRRHAWRFFINSIYNYNLAYNLDLRPALNSEWFDEVRGLVPESEIHGGFQFPVKRMLTLATPIYVQHLDLDFVVKVRKDLRFYEGIKALEDARADRDQELYQEKLEGHLEFISRSFAEHLESLGRKDLVEKAVREIWFEPAYRTIQWGGPVVTMLALIAGQPILSALLLGSSSAGAGAIAMGLVDRLFGSPKVRSPEFKNFMHDLEGMGSDDKL